MSSLKCTRCGSSIDCQNLIPSEIESVVKGRIEWCQKDRDGPAYSLAGEYGKCGFSAHIDFYEHFMKNSPKVPALLKPPVFAQTNKEKVEADAGLYYGNDAPAEKGAFSVVSKTDEEIVIEIPDPILILVNKKGHISVFAGE